MKIRLLFMLLGLALAIPAAHAGVIATEDAAAAGERERLYALLERPQAAGQLEKLGITAGQARERVGAMNDEEVRSLAGRLEGLPAGGDMSQPETLMWIILILLLVLAA